MNDGVATNRGLAGACASVRITRVAVVAALSFIVNSVPAKREVLAAAVAATGSGGSCENEENTELWHCGMQRSPRRDGPCLRRVGSLRALMDGSRASTANGVHGRDTEQETWSDTGVRAESAASSTEHWKSSVDGASAPSQVSNSILIAVPAATPKNVGSRRTVDRP